MFGTMDVSASALVAQRVRLDVIANNLANVSTTHNEKGEPIPYRRRDVIFQVGVPEKGSPLRGVSIPKIYEDPSAFRKAYEPDNPDAVGDDRDYFVYTPAGYDPRAATRSPVLYLLHGYSDDASAWTSVGRAHVILDNLIARREAVDRKSTRLNSSH